MTKMGMCEKNGPKWRIPPEPKLIAHGTGRFYQMTLPLFVRDTEAHGVADIPRGEGGAAGSLATGLRAPSVLGCSKKVDLALHAHPPHDFWFIRIIS